MTKKQEHKMKMDLKKLRRDQRIGTNVDTFFRMQKYVPGNSKYHKLGRSA